MGNIIMGLAIFYGCVIAVAIIIWYAINKPGEKSFPEYYQDELEDWQRWDDQFK